MNIPEITKIKAGMTTVYLLAGEKAVLIDTSVPGKENLILKKIKKAGVDPSDIALIVLTHTHWDHTGSLVQLAEKTGAHVLVHKSEGDRLSRGFTVSPGGITSWGRFLAAGLVSKMQPRDSVIYQPDILMEDEFSLAPYGMGGKIIHTPGHSTGSVSVILDDGRAFVGDMAMSGFPLRLTPGLPIFAEEPEMIDEGWKRIRRAGAETIYPAHGKSFPLRSLQ